MRLLTILAGYATSSVAAMVVLVIFGWIDSGSLSLDRIGFIAPLFVGGAANGALFALPIAVPTIIFTEWTRLHSVWIFIAAGLATGVVMIGFLGTFSLAEAIALQPYAVRDIIVISAVTITASVTYWLVVWRMFPPKPTQTIDGTAPE